MIRGFLDRLYLFAGYVAGVFLIAIFVLMMLLSAGRPLGFNIPAGDDFMSWCMAATAFLGLAHTFRARRDDPGRPLDRPLRRPHPPRIRDRLALGRRRFFIAFFAWYAVLLTFESWRFHDMSQGVSAGAAVDSAARLRGGLVILAHRIRRRIDPCPRGNTPRYEKPKPQTAEEVVEQAIQSGCLTMDASLSASPHCLLIFLTVLLAAACGSPWR